MKIMKNKMMVVGVVLLVAIGAAAGFYYYKNNQGSITADQAKTKAEKFITDNLVQPGTKILVKGVSVENGLYKIDLKIADQDIVAYMTRDGKNFFPKMMNIEEVENQAKQQTANDPSAQQPAAEIPKEDKPVVEAFVMSYCPYGTQIEKGLLPVLDTLGKKVDFQLKFVSYAMHDKKEVDENLKQYCIQKNEPSKLESYLGCFLKDSSMSDQCNQTAGIDQAKLASCISASDAEFKITESFNDKSTWNGGQYPPFNVDKADNEKYAVQGSPTLVVNGIQAESGRDPAGLLATICKGFNNPPQECQTQLSSEAPSPGFGEGTAAASGSNGGCAN